MVVMKYFPLLALQQRCEFRVKKIWLEVFMGENMIYYCSQQKVQYNQ